MRLTVNSVIYFYIFICIALLVFNLSYIFRSTAKTRAKRRRAKWWGEIMLEEFARPPQPPGGNAEHRKHLGRKLRKVEELMAFSEVLERWKPGREKELHGYFLTYRRVFRDLAVRYGKKSAMERAFFAYVIAVYHPPLGEEHDILVEILLTYLDGSTVFCRENVLQALYQLGSAPAVEHAFQIFNDQGWYHHPRLLSDGLAKFTGDKAALVRRLWRHKHQWEEFLLVATLQFAAAASPEFAQELAPSLEDSTLTLEVRFALVRYFQRHPCPDAQGALLRFLRGSGGEGELAIAAASALAAYHNETVHTALLDALYSRDWYIRHNAAQSLKSQGLTEADVVRLGERRDRYALEMLAYVLGLDAAEERDEKAAPKEAGVLEGAGV